MADVKLVVVEDISVKIQFVALASVVCPVVGPGSTVQ